MIRLCHSKPFQQLHQQLAQLYQIFNCQLDLTFIVIEVSTTAIIAATSFLRALIVTIVGFLLEVIIPSFTELTAFRFHRSYWQHRYQFLLRFMNFAEHLQHFIEVQ